MLLSFRDVEFTLNRKYLDNGETLLVYTLKALAYQLIMSYAPSKKKKKFHKLQIKYVTNQLESYRNLISS